MIDLLPAGARWAAQKPLSGRRLDVLRGLAAGLTDQELADRLAVSITTVRTHIEDVRWQLGARNRTHAVAIAISAGAISLVVTDTSPSPAGGAS